MSGTASAISCAHGGAIATATSAPWNVSPMKAFVPTKASDRPMICSRSRPLSATMSATSIVPVTPCTVTALLPGAAPRRSASGGQGERSSHSPTTIPVTRPGWPNTLFDEDPTLWPATLRMIRRVARPIAGPGPASPPKQPAP